MAKNRIETLKKRKIIQRFKNRKSCQATMDKKEQDVYLIDLILSKLYNEGDKTPASIDKDILEPNHIKFTNAGSDRLWDVIMSTGLVKPVIGFGKSGNLALTTEGYQLMTTFGSYKNFIEQREQQARAAAPQAVPQFIFSALPINKEGNEIETPNENEDKKKKTGSK